MSSQRAMGMTVCRSSGKHHTCNIETTNGSFLGAPDVWELRDKANLPADTPFRFGVAEDWSFK